MLPNVRGSKHRYDVCQSQLSQVFLLFYLFQLYVLVVKVLYKYYDTGLIAKYFNQHLAWIVLSFLNWFILGVEKPLWYLISSKKDRKHP